LVEIVEVNIQGIVDITKAQALQPPHFTKDTTNAQVLQNKQPFEKTFYTSLPQQAYTEVKRA